MTLIRHLAIAAVASAAFAAGLPAVSPAQAAGGTAPFCIARGGVNGDAAYTGSCSYFDYQQCLQAAAEARGNCVQNIDYKGPASTQAARPRRARS
jgi:hypothetical protein